MKPNIFIGSSVEGLSIAYAIQENLEHSANVTVWDQGIFSLSSTALDDLIIALDDFDFGIFVFKPDDLAQIRNNQLNIVRDNVLFEFGLFIGRLGKDKVFFLLPRNAPNFHLPTDLAGLNKGTYDNDREDGRLQAALGPFCNQVRQQINKFIQDERYNLSNESKKAKSIALNKPMGWELSLAAELLTSKFVQINKRYEELKNGRSFTPHQHYNAEEFLAFFQVCLQDLLKLVDVFKKLYLEDMQVSFGRSGESGNINLIKEVTDKMISVSYDLLSWEERVYRCIPPVGLLEVKEIMKGWSEIIFGQINKLPHELLKVVKASENPHLVTEPIKVELVFEEPPRLHEAMPYFERVLGNKL